MPILQILFYGFAFIAVMSAVMVVVAKSPVQSALFLVLSFIATAGLWMLCQAEFLSLVLILVYVGAVMTLFLFVIMMLNIEVKRSTSPFVRYAPFAVVIAGLLAALIILTIKQHAFGLETQDVFATQLGVSNIKALGAVLYTQYAFAFELAGVLLLVAILAAISLAHRPARQSKTQNIVAQIKVRREDRLRVLTGKETL